jgi:hypothetical protein
MHKRAILLLCLLGLLAASLGMGTAFAAGPVTGLLVQKSGPSPVYERSPSGDAAASAYTTVFPVRPNVEESVIGFVCYWDYP